MKSEEVFWMFLGIGAVLLNIALPITDPRDPNG